jgi:hypothetical protein
MAKTDKKEARVLIDGLFGKINDVVTLTEDEIKTGKDAGQLDDAPDAVAYAKSISR